MKNKFQQDIMSQIGVLNSKLFSTVDDNYPIGLVKGKLGLCVYFYYLSRWEERDDFKEIAENLLDDVVSRLSNTIDITVESGLAGVAIGISHLIKENFIDGDINEVLEDVDSAIFKKLAFLVYKDAKKYIRKAELIHILYYLYVRYKEQTEVDKQYIFQELMIRTVEMFKDDLQLSFFDEHFSFSIRNFQLPFFLFVFAKIYDLNIYNDRITKILEEYIKHIVSIYPVSHANRLYLLCGLINVKPCLSGYGKEIDNHIQLLKDGIDIEYIINKEMRNQDIYLMEGLSSVYMLLYYLQLKHPAYCIDYYPQLFFTKISNSEAWSALQNREFYFHKYNGLLDGFPGAYLVLLNLKKYLL
ncbi:hypothetical protein [Macellibacteroides fermentans]|uniref:hypothetical protein n=1 Tax=Macellibacteroides fermentans TaxID=879969 RepID=UPI00406C616A